MQDQYHNSIDATIAAAGHKATMGGAAASGLSWFLSSEFGVLCGILIGFLGLMVNFWFRRREDKRHQAEHEARMRKLRDSAPMPLDTDGTQ
jgi:hypothetical protein